MPNPYDNAAADIAAEEARLDEEQGTPNPYDQAAGQVAKGSRALLKASIESGKAANPDNRARAMSLAKAARLPVDLVERDLEGVAAQVRTSYDPERLRQDHPELAAWLEHPDRAAISNDDLPALRQLDVAARAMRGEDPTGLLPPGYLFEGDKIIRPIGDGSQAEVWNTLDDLGRDLRARGETAAVQEIDARLAADRYAQEYGWTGNILAGAGQSIMATQRALGTRSAYDRQGEEVLEASELNAPGWFGDVQRGIGGLIADAPLMLAGGPLAEGVAVLNRFTRARGAVSQVLGRAAARRVTTGTQVAGAVQPLALREGLAEGQEHGFEDGALAWLVESAVPGAFGRTGLERAIVGGATNEMAAEGWRGAVKRLLVDAGLEGTEEAVTEFAHAVRERATGADPAALDPDKLWRRLTSAASVGAIAGGAFNLPGTIAEKFAQDGEEAQRAITHRERLDRMVDLLAESKTNGRAPEEVAELANTTLGQGGRHVFVDAEQFRAAFPDPAAAAQALGVSQEYATALATGGQVQVPTVTLAQQAAKDETFRGLLDHVRRVPTARTASEADEFNARAPDTVKRLASEAKAATAGNATDHDKQVAEIEQTLVDRLSAVSPEHIDRGAIKRQAKVVASALGTLAKRSGKTPSELFTLKLRGDTSRLMRGEQFDLMDAMIERLRRQEVPSDREVSGPSLVDFLRKQGLADRALAGELKSLAESDRTRKPGERNLIREDGIDLDTAAMAAAEAGYITEATPNALLTALDDEVRSGKATFSTKGGDPQAQAARESLDLLTDAIREAGGNLSMGNKEIRALLADLEEKNATTLGQGANAVAPKGKSLDVDALLRQWRKATGDRTPVGGIEAWEQLVEESAAVDEANQTTLGQGGKEKRRADISFKKGAGLGRNYIVSLFKGADASSFLHEAGGHWLLELFGDLAADPNASAELKADWQRILDWLGAKDLASITEEQHEQWARGFERYIMEGVAPAAHLREAFARLKAWMVAIYRSVANLGVELTPEIRGVMDRLVAAEDAADLAEAEHGDALLPPEAFPSLAEWEKYRQAVMASRQATRDRIEAQLLEAYQQEASKAWQAQRAEVEADTAREIDAQPVYQVMSVLQHGRLPDGTSSDEMAGTKLDKADLVAQWGEAALEKLPGPGRKANAGPYVYAVEGGLPVDQVARSWGFPSGDAMVEALIQAPDRASLIQTTTDKRMRELRPDPMTDGTLTDKAQAAMATDQRAEVFRRELNALGRRTGQTPAPVEVLRQVARDQVARTRVYDLAPDKFRVAAAKAARGAIDAAARQQWDEAYRFKTQEALNLELYRAARDAREAGEQGRAYLKTFDTLAKRERIGKAAGGYWTVFDANGEEVDVFEKEEQAREEWKKQPQGSTYRRTNTYTEQIDSILDGFGLRRASNLSLRRRDGFRKWIERKQAEGEPVDIDPQVIEDLGNRNWNDLTVEEQAAVVDAVRNIEKLANLKNKLMRASRERELQKAREEIVGTIVRNQPRELPDGQFDDVLSRATGKLVGYFEAHRKDSFLARRMDGDQDGGVVWDYLIRSRNEAAGEQETRSAEESAKLSALFKAWGKGAGAFKQEIPGTRLRMTTEQRIALALNWGNQEGRQRVMAWLKRGGWTSDDAQAVLDSLDAKDWALVNGIVAQINNHWSDVAALEQRTKGIAPEKVQALPFVTKQGVQPGGYYPIKYDPKKSHKAGDLQAAMEAKEMLRAAGAHAQTRRGHTKLRAMKVDDLALRFDFGVVGEHLSEVIHDLTHRELLLDQNRLLRDKDIGSAIRSRYGRGALDQFVTTAADIAKGDAPARNAAEKFAKAMRINNSAATFGFNLTSALMNLTGFAQSITRVGPSYMAQAVARLFRSPDQVNNGFRFATEKSAMMKNRANTLLREVADATRAVQTGGKLQTMQRWGYYPMMQVQRMVDTVTWLGAYEQALAKAEKAGKSGPDADAWAVQIADQTVVDTQGSGRIADLSAFQRGGELSKLLTAFYSYFNVAANLQGSAIRRVVQNPKNAGQWGRLVTDTMLVWTLPALFGSLIKSALQGDDRDEDDRWKNLAKEQVSYGLGMLVGLREASGLVEGHFGYSGPAGTRGLAALAKGIGETFDGDLGLGDAKAATNLAGVFTGLPAVQINRLLDAIAEDAANGKEGDALRRTLFGAPRRD